MLCHTTFIILLSGCDPLQFFFLGILSHVSAAIPRLRDIKLLTRYGQYQGWLTRVRFQILLLLLLLLLLLFKQNKTIKFIN